MKETKKVRQRTFYKYLLSLFIIPFSLCFQGCTNKTEESVSTTNLSESEDIIMEQILTIWRQFRPPNHSA